MQGPGLDSSDNASTVEPAGPEVAASHGRLRDRLRRYFPAAAFLTGFLWDAVTLGRTITTLDLVILFGYYTAAAVILILIGRAVEFRFSRYLNYALQFLFGGIFSALVIFYFLSSSALPSLAVVALLVVVLIANEFLEKRYSQLTVSWTLFAVCGIMLFNFALPHLFRSVHPLWFYVSTLCALAFVGVVRIAGRQESDRMWPALVVAGVLLLLHFFNAIPPVPLVKKQMMIAHGVERVGSDYLVTVERRPPLERWRPSGPTIHYPGGRLYCFTSIFAPSGLETVLRHRWERADPRSGVWETMSTVSFPVAGGRQGGYRGYSWKQNISPGSWRVRAELDSGATISVMRFEVRRGEPKSRRQLRL